MGWAGLLLLHFVIYLVGLQTVRAASCLPPPPPPRCPLMIDRVDWQTSTGPTA